jgi:hypothetical protein
LHLVYEPPDLGALARLRSTLEANLDRAGYRYRTETSAPGRAALLRVAARPG